LGLISNAGFMLVSFASFVLHHAMADQRDASVRGTGKAKIEGAVMENRLPACHGKRASSLFLGGGAVP
jgi:hypothetical protein